MMKMKNRLTYKTHYCACCDQYVLEEDFCFEERTCYFCVYGKDDEENDGEED